MPTLLNRCQDCLVCIRIQHSASQIQVQDFRLFNKLRDALDGTHVATTRVDGIPSEIKFSHRTVVQQTLYQCLGTVGPYCIP